MKLSIGLLAHNEEKNIEATLCSLLEQSLLKQNLADVTAVELIIVSNASTDRTVEIAENILSVAIPNEASSALAYQIISIKEAGKTNAWNQFVHRISAKDSDYLVLMDADIQFFQPEVLREMFLSLKQNPDKWINTGYPLKSAAVKKNKTLLERISLSVSKVSQARSPQVCGQLYMARSEKLRLITLPVGTNGDDGFIAEMICTNLFTQPYNAAKMMLLLETPSHTFEAYTSPQAFIRHEREMVKVIIGHQWLYTHLRNIKKDSELSVSDYIRMKNEVEPDWVAKVYRENTDSANQKWSWFIPSWLFFRRFKSFRNKSLLKQIIIFPALFFASLVDWFVCCLANYDLNRRAYQTYWR